MSDKEKQAVAWMLGKIELLDKLCEGEKMTEKQIENSKQKAVESDDYIKLIMVLYKQAKDRIDSN